MLKSLEIIRRDIKLAKQILSGNEDAFKEFYDKNHVNVYGVCIRILKQSDLAEDMCQQTFIQAWKKISIYKGEARLSTWLHRIAVNECLMYLRKSRVKWEKTSLEDESVEVVLANLHHSQTPKIGLSIDLENAIKELPKGYKEVLILKDVEGLEHGEVAKTLGCSDGNSKSQLHKARLRMRELLNKRNNPRIA